MISLVAFDADDTLWHNEPLFAHTTARFRQLLSGYHTPEWIEERLFETEMRNLRHYGYGIKSFTLSMIETAVELTEGRIRGAEIGEILSFAKQMLEAPIDLLPDVEPTIRRLAESYAIVVITKGDLFDQESKLARSGLGDYFGGVEIVSEKTEATYRGIVEKHGVALGDFVMVGDSLKSDILPVVRAGGHAIHIPYGTVWKHEVVPDEMSAEFEFLRAAGIREVPGLLDELNLGKLERSAR